MEIAELKRGILNLQVDIRAFEEKYKMSSDEFFERFEKGAVGDSEDFMIWAGLRELLRNNQRRLDELE
jgi:hypothetical protein